jgi:hypothetical protein
MKELALTFLGRGLLCAAASWLAWRFGGIFGVCASLALWGLAFSRPLIDPVIEMNRQARTATLKPLEGRHAVFRGLPVQVLEDADHVRWVRAADVKRIVGYTASEAALALTYPAGWRRLGSPSMPHFSDEALLAHLAKERAPVAAKFRGWVEREIAFPARRQRERLGIRARAPDAADSDA